jgi:hypothetical protein
VTKNFDFIKKIESYGSQSGKTSKKVKWASCRVVEKDADL